MAMLNRQRIQSVIMLRMNADSDNFNANQTLAEAAHHIERGEYIGARALCESVLTDVPDDVDARSHRHAAISLAGSDPAL